MQSEIEASRVLEKTGIDPEDGSSIALQNHLFEKARILQRCPQFVHRGPYDHVNHAAADTVKCTLTPIYASIRDGTHALRAIGASAARYS